MNAFRTLQQEQQLQRVRNEETDRRARLQSAADVVIEAPRSLKLRSPDGTYWGLVVDDSGNLSTVNMGSSL